ncbi:hypothetical protein GQR58_014978 [Nymphon striatum]|nr:hypothetical protein GQR58_014978 [Nymphon striatum]
MLAQQATFLLEAEDIRQMFSVCTNVWASDLGNSKHLVAKISKSQQSMKRNILDPVGYKKLSRRSDVIRPRANVIIDIKIAGLDDTPDQSSDSQTFEAGDNDATSILNELLRNIPENDAMTAGYRFCAIETIRFLIEEENISADNPVITELMSHLVEQHNRMQPTGESMTTSGGNDSAGDSPCHTSEDEDCENSDPNVLPQRTIAASGGNGQQYSLTTQREKKKAKYGADAKHWCSDLTTVHNSKERIGSSNPNQSDPTHNWKDVLSIRLPCRYSLDGRISPLLEKSLICCKFIVSHFTQILQYFYFIHNFQMLYIVTYLSLLSIILSNRNIDGRYFITFAIQVINEINSLSSSHQLGRICLGKESYGGREKRQQISRSNCFTCRKNFR